MGTSSNTGKSTERKIEIIDDFVSGGRDEV